MTKVTIFSGFLGAGKTTLIKKLIAEVWAGQKIVLIENEFGEIGIDGGFLKDAGVQINEMNSGCICCSLVGDFGRALEKVLDEYAPERILIEPSGVGKLSDVTRAVEQIGDDRLVIDGLVTVADATKCRLYHKNFGEFFNDQIRSAATVVLSRTAGLSAEKLDTALAVVRELNPRAAVVTTPWDELPASALLDAVEHSRDLSSELLAELMHDDDEDEHEHCHHHHDDDEDEHEHCHHHHDDDDEDEHEHCHHHHHDDDDEDEHEHCHHYHHEDDEDEHDHEHHHHHYDENGVCSCGHHHHHHHADEVFTSFGRETARRYTAEELSAMLSALADADTYGTVLRAKGILPAADGSWLHFDYVPGEQNVRTGAADYTGRLCVIGAKLHEDALEALFKL